MALRGGPLQDRCFSARYLIVAWTVVSCGRIGYDPLAEDIEGAAGGGGSTVLTTGSPTTVGTTGSGGTNGGTAGSVDGGPLGGSGGAGGAGGAVGTGGAATAGTGGTTGGSGGLGGATCRSGVYAAHAYAFCDTPVNYAMARSDCAAKSMRLARIDDDPENTWVRSMIPVADQISNMSIVWRWLGGNALVTAGDWRWEDGQAFWSGGVNGSAVNGAYTNWPSGEPGPSGECVFMAARDGAWNTTTANQSHPYVCEQY
jgi:Lectin C-type domain